jgi:23S rRNA (guanine2535-N1)-methyltransferase
MPYVFATQEQDYSDLASGKVLRSQPGYPAFPIRLASEIFQRCLALRAASQVTAPCVVYDPCCGAGYLLTVVTILNWEAIQTVIASDIDGQAVSLAERNLDLLTLNGLDRREEEIAALLKQYGKASHQEALEAVQRLRQQITPLAQNHPIHPRTFQADAADGAALASGLKDTHIDIVLTDIPYGQHSQWRSSIPRASSADPVWLLLDALSGVLSPQGLVAVTTDKRQKVMHAAYHRVAHFQVGKRRVVILQMAPA